MNVRILLGVVVLGFLPLRSLAQDVCPSPCGEGQLDEFSADLDSLRQFHHLPGLAAAIVRDGELVWSRGYGLAYVDPGHPVLDRLRDEDVVVGEPPG